MSEQVTVNISGTASNLNIGGQRNKMVVHDRERQTAGLVGELAQLIDGFDGPEQTRNNLQDSYAQLTDALEAPRRDKHRLLEIVASLGSAAGAATAIGSLAAEIGAVISTAM